MPGTYRIDLENRVVCSSAWGMLTDEEVYLHASALAADPRFKPDFRQFTDFTRVVDLRLSAQGIHRVARINPFGAGSRRGWVTGADAVFGMLRMYEMVRLEGGDELQTFRDRAAALEWLGLPPNWTPPEASPDDPVFQSAPTDR